MAHKTSGFTFFALAIAAAAAGALVGVLTAPASGQETRRKLGKQIDRETEALRKRGRRALKDFNEFASEQYEQGKEKINEMMHS